MTDFTGGPGAVSNQDFVSIAGRVVEKYLNLHTYVQ